MALPLPARETVARWPASPLHLTGGDAESRVLMSRSKRLLDIIATTALLLVSAPIALLIAIAVKLDSPGPVLLRQERCGVRGRRFECLKFRSMYHGADEGPHRTYVRQLMTNAAPETGGDGVFKLVNDGRVTRVGRFLRGTSLDELPQLWNVLRGEMSLVGPRPPLPYEVELYDERQQGRLVCRPGLTGLWQVSGRNQVSYRDMVEIDLDYIRNWSIGLDVRILLRTLPVVLFNSGKAR